MEILHHVNQGLRAHTLYKRDVEYVVKDGEVIIVDEFTGRLMPGRRWSDGLHQAVEAKEGVKIQQENQTLATITFQNYFRMYKKLAGMTGTAETEAEEFLQDLQARCRGDSDQPHAAPHRKSRRDLSDGAREVRSGREEIKQCNEKGQPVLVGTISIDRSEKLSSHAEARGRQARRAEREVPREGSGDRRAGRTQRRGDDCHQHGRPRNRHSARRQSGLPGARRSAQARHRSGTGDAGAVE